MFACDISAPQRFGTSEVVLIWIFGLEYLTVYPLVSPVSEVESNQYAGTNEKHSNSTLISSMNYT